MRTEIVMLTPKMAGEFLAKSVKNRPLSATTVRRFSEAQLRGEWRLNGEAICFSTEGLMMNGQHRCHSVIVSGVSIPVVVVYDLDPACFDTYDIGRIRNTADVFALEGRADPRELAAAARYTLKYEVGKASTSGNFNFAPSPSQLRDVLVRHPELSDFVHRVSTRKSRTVYPSKSILAVLWYLFTKANGELADWFVDRLIDGKNLPAHEPVFILREHLLGARAGQYSPSRFNVLAAVTIKAWNATVSQRPIQLLVWRGNEPFPVIAGCPLQPVDIAA